MVEAEITLIELLPRDFSRVQQPMRVSTFLRACGVSHFAKLIVFERDSPGKPGGAKKGGCFRVVAVFRGVTWDMGLCW